MNKNYLSKVRLLFVLYLLVVAFLCFWRFNNVSTITEDILGLPIDKVVHFMMFLPFPVLLYASIGKVFLKPVKAIVFTLGIFLVGCIVAGTTEIVQGQLPYRSMDPADFRADAIAMAVSSLAVYIWNMRRKI